MASGGADRSDRKDWNDLKDDLKASIPVILSFLLVFLPWLAAYRIFRSYAEWALLLGLVLGPIVGFFVAFVTVACGKPKEEPKPDVEKLYLDGKMQRYSLLFAVNGGVFAVVQFLQRAGNPPIIDIKVLSIGAAFFTVLMVLDIWLWGAEMRKKHGSTMFRPVGQLILLMIGALVFCGWIEAWHGRT